MQIDLFTVVVQIVNFVILLLLLRAVLYKPVIEAMDERERRIAGQLHAAAQKDEDARSHLEALRREREALDDQRKALVNEMRTEVEAKRTEALEQVRQESAELRSRWQQTIEREKEAFLGDLRQRVSQQVFAIARRALADLANVELERHIATVFSQRLTELDADERERLHDDLARADNVALLRSAFPLPDDVREQLAGAIQQVLGGNANMVFESVDDLIGGIELRVHGRVVRWSLEHYLSALESQVLDTVEQGT